MKTDKHMRENTWPRGSVDDIEPTCRDAAGQSDKRQILVGACWFRTSAKRHRSC